ncbi:MAG: hypothetical protein AAGC47_09120 [Bacteroidota bacterium]
MRHLLPLILLLISGFNSYAQEAEPNKKWEAFGFYGAYFSPVQGDALNQVMTDSGLNPFKWSSFGFSNFAHARNGKHNLVSSLDLTFKQRGMDGFKNSTGNLDFLFGYGYTILENKRFEAHPFIGAKAFWKGYWVSEENEPSLGQYLSEPSKDYSFFSEQFAAALGIQVILKVQNGIPLLSLSTDFSFISTDTNFGRIGAALTDERSVQGLWTVRLGVRVF